MSLYYSGFNGGSCIFPREISIETFTRVPFTDIKDFAIGWNYFLMIGMTGKELFISGKLSSKDNGQIRPLNLPDLLRHSGIRQVLAEKEFITILSNDHSIWRFNVYNESWKRIENFINMDPTHPELVMQISATCCSVIALTNIGRCFSIPILLATPRNFGFTDVACGIDHTLLLTNTGEVYSVGMGTRGQLGHGDLEDEDEPKLVQALAGLRIVKVAAAGWHSAAITKEGDLYIWGWNVYGQLGIEDDKQTAALPTLIDFDDDTCIVQDVQCGNSNTICLMTNGTIWGCGSNKYGQLGLPLRQLPASKKFTPLPGIDGKLIKAIKCNEWGTLLLTN